MDRTAELRWFFRRLPPPPVLDWFDQTADAPATRTDSYLVLAGTDALGVKVRGGTTRLELKLRPRPAEPLRLPGGVTGQVEEWQRWSLPRPAFTRFLPRLGLPKGAWRQVAKQRRTTTIPFGPGSGCRVEITALRIDGRDWWTVGFEAYGTQPDLGAALGRGADEVFGAIDLTGSLGADVSCGYPGWLATL